MIMALDWLDVSDLSFNTLLLLERFQLNKFPGWVPQQELAIALHGNPVVAWYMSHKCPEIEEWLGEVKDIIRKLDPPDLDQIRQAEKIILQEINDLLVYVVDPKIYDEQPFLMWDSNELTDLVDFSGKVVVDVGSGTGRLALIAAPQAKAVFAVEPVGNLRYYLKDKARCQGLTNVYPIDGLNTGIPFPDYFADVTMSGHVFGDLMEEEYQEMARVTRPGGWLILCPGTSRKETRAHEYLLSQKFEWSEFKEPGDHIVRKYWKTV